MNHLAVNKGSELFSIKLGCLLFWAVWFLLVFTTNILDFATAFNLLPINWRFHSGNYQALANVVSIYHFPHYALNILFALDILAQGLCAVLFFIAFVCFWRRSNYVWVFINLAFGLSLLLWGIFVITEEIFIAYSFEATHDRLLIFEMLTLLLIHFLPDNSRRKPNQVP